MAAKRFFDEDDHQQPNHKRPKTRFASVIREVVMVNFFENFCSALEPMLRRVVSEEVENGLRRRCPTAAALRQPPSRMIENVPASLQLSFPKPLSLPIFTGTKIVDADGNPLQILLLDTHANIAVPSRAHALKLEIVVLDGDFPKGDDSTWTCDNFDRSIVKERTGKRPLLTGDLSITMRDGVASLGEIEFTDNSSWIRCRKFRIGARVVSPSPGHGRELIHEAITQAFVVKDHRGELYQKHHPPALKDHVWRLQKIGKGGSFHQRLEAHAVNTVQDFLKLFYADSSKLRKILGNGMSEKTWKATVKHAKECVVGNTLYKFHAPNNCTLTFNPVCKLLSFESNGQLFHQDHLTRIQPHAYLESLVKDAYTKWETLEVVHHTPLLTQDVEQYSDEEQHMMMKITNNGEGDYSENDPWDLEIR